MPWTQITFVVDANQVERLSSMLEAFLAQAVTTENAGEDEFYEVAFPGTPDWQKVRVTGLFDTNIDLESIIEFAQSHLSSHSDAEIPVSITQLADQDWERVCLTSFKPIPVGTNLWVCPSWCEPSEPDSRNIILDPGLAFGTGTHATTHLCLDWISKQNLGKKRVLDYGSGSGILAIAALFSHASHADAVDIDPLAVKACAENAERNNVANKMQSFLPADLPNTLPQSYDLIIANILAKVIIELRETLLLHLKPDGTLLLTGILITQAQQVITAFGNEFIFEQQNEQQGKDQWCLLHGVRKSSE